MGVDFNLKIWDYAGICLKSIFFPMGFFERDNALDVRLKDRSKIMVQNDDSIVYVWDWKTGNHCFMAENETGRLLDVCGDVAVAVCDLLITHYETNKDKSY